MEPMRRFPQSIWMSVLSNRASDSPEDRAAYVAATLDLRGDRDPDADPVQSLQMFGMLRAANLRLLDRATPAMARVGVHSERGEESIGYLCRLYAADHLAAGAGSFHTCANSRR